MSTPAHARTIDQKFVTLFEAAKRSLLAAEELHRRFAAELLSLESDLLANIDIGVRAIPPLLSAVSFVDFAHRFGSLVDALPMISKKSLEMRKLQDALKPVEIARHHLQHLRGERELASDAEISYSILGQLSWTNEDICFFVALSDPHPIDHASIAFDSRTGKWTSKHRYTIKNISIDIDLVADAMRGAFSWISSKICFTDAEFGKLQWGKTIAMTFRLSINAPRENP